MHNTSLLPLRNTPILSISIIKMATFNARLPRTRLRYSNPSKLRGNPKPVSRSAPGFAPGSAFEPSSVPGARPSNPTRTLYFTGDKRPRDKDDDDDDEDAAGFGAFLESNNNNFDKSGDRDGNEDDNNEEEEEEAEEEEEDEENIVRFLVSLGSTIYITYTYL